MICVIGFVN